LATVKFDLGAQADMLSPAEHREHLGDALADFQRERLRGVKHMQLPQLQGAAAGGVLLLGQAPPVSGPRPGFCWSIQALIVDGLTTGATPDVINFYRNNPTGAKFWQLNGNSPGVTFGKLQRTLYGGDTLLVANVGTFAATGTITVSGELIECPAEMLGKLAT
jgi:hypothetical protein